MAWQKSSTPGGMSQPPPVLRVPPRAVNVPDGVEADHSRKWPPSELFSTITTPRPTLA
jgi:hypothetical protein